MEIYNGQPTDLSGRSDSELAVYEFLNKLGIEYQTVCHPAAYTMEECEAVEKELGTRICKNLFLCNRQETQFYLLILPGDKVFKTKFLSSQLGCARLSFANETHMQNLLHIKPGSVSPMGLMNDVEHKIRFVIDKDLLDWEYVGCHPCVNTATLKLKMKDLMEVFAKAVEHEGTVVELISEAE